MKVQLEIDLRSAFPAVRDQGARPTCLAHATTAAHEKSRGSTTPLSSEYLHFFATRGVTLGASFDEIARTLEQKGQPIEDHCPYWNTDPSKGWRPRARLRVFRRASQAKSLNMGEVEQLIRDARVPVLGITLTNDFLKPTPPWRISSDGPLRGRHAVVGVGIGIHRGSRIILIRNSWGTDWAENGYAWLDRTFLSLHLREVLILTHEVIS